MDYENNSNGYIKFFVVSGFNEAWFLDFNESSTRGIEKLNHPSILRVHEKLL